MKKDILNRNKAIVSWALVLLVAVDLVLAVVNWRLDQAPRIPPVELTRLGMMEKSYRADTDRLQTFQRQLPADEKQWDQFFTANFRQAGAGYSAISGDLGELSRSAGLRADTIMFHEHPPDARGLVEVDISTAVEGDYESLINFLNKLEHSDNFYVLDSLALASSDAGKLRLNLQLRTYFRT